MRSLKVVVLALACLACFDLALGEFNHCKNQMGGFLRLCLLMQSRSDVFIGNRLCWLYYVANELLVVRSTGEFAIREKFSPYDRTDITVVLCVSTELYCIKMHREQYQPWVSR